MEKRRIPSTLPPAIFTFSRMSLSVMLPEYAQLKPLAHLNMVLLSLSAGAISETILAACRFSSKVSTEVAVGSTLLTKSSIEISCTRENFFGSTAMSRSISLKISVPLRMRCAALRLANRMLFTVISSRVAKRRPREDKYPRSEIVCFAFSSIFFV